MFILTPHWCSHCCARIEQWRWDTLDLREVSEASHPRAPWGQSPVLIWPARKTAVPHRLTVRWSHPNTQGGWRLVGMRNVKEGGRAGGMEGGHLWRGPPQLWQSDPSHITTQ